MKRVLEQVIYAGARLAEPGEFTKRAFLNGKMDLSQSEAVMDMIQAKNEYALKSSMSQLRGSVHRAIEEIREKILYEIAFIESALDDPEHISIDGYGEKLNVIVDEVLEKTERLLKTSGDGKMIQEGIRTVIVGKPNAGKSSLLNLLLGEERAIVTDIAGTTRDTLEETVMLQGISLRMVDTAGIRDTSDLVEKIGVDKARASVAEADLVLYVVDSSVPPVSYTHLAFSQVMVVFRLSSVLMVISLSGSFRTISEKILASRATMPFSTISPSTLVSMPNSISFDVNFISPAEASIKIHSKIGIVVLEGTAFITMLTLFTRFALEQISFIMCITPFLEKCRAYI